MSELTVGSIGGLAVNNNIVTVPSNHMIKQSGMVLQTVYTKVSGPVSSNSGYWSTTSTARVSTGISVTLTPKFANSKLLVMMDIQHYLSGSPTARGTTWWLFRDGVNQSSGGYQNAAIFYHESNSNEAYHTVSAKFYVDATSTSPTTFVIHAAVWSSGTLTIGGHDGQTSLIVQEIAQ